MHWFRLEGVNPTLHERYISEEVTGDWLGVHPPLFVLPWQRRHWELTLKIQDKDDRWPEGISLRRGELDYCP